MNEAKIKDILKQEFAKLVSHIPKSDFEAVVVFSAEETAVEGENGERIRAGLEFILNAKSKPRFIFLGTVNHIVPLEEYIEKKGYDIDVLYPTRKEHGSTWTQVRGLAEFLTKKPLGNLLFVSHAYHIPRIARYLKKYLKDTEYDFLPVGDPVEQAEKFKGEIGKIIRYAEKGDLPLLIG